MKPLIEVSEKQYSKAPEGQHIARLVGLIDLGTQTGSFEGQEWKKAKLYLQFEVYPEDLEGKPVYDSEGKPFLIGQEFSARLSTKGNLLPFINQWRGKALETQDFPFDFSRMLGKHGLMTVVWNESKDGKSYANIQTVTPVPRKLSTDATGKSILPPGLAVPYFFDLDSTEWDKMIELMGYRMWDGIRGKIASSPEYQARVQPLVQKQMESANPVKAGVESLNPTAFEDDIPF